MYYFATPWETVALRAFPDLTASVDEILLVMAESRSDAQISQRLAVSEKMVRNHVSNSFKPLQVGDRAQPIVWGREAGPGDRYATT